MTFPLVEYKVFGDGYETEGVITIDLRAVTSARVSNSKLFVTYFGASYELQIDAYYPDFVKDWHRAKEIPT